MRPTEDKKGLWLPKGAELTPVNFLLSVPVYSPRALYERLGRIGYQGQDEARRAVCLCAYRHVKRLRSIHLDKIPVDKLPARSNALLMGPTGCGKSYLIELLFGEILGLPYVIAEMTRFTETGYVGDDVYNILNQLIDQVRGRIDIAECGIIALDEFDKIAANGSTIRFGGGGTTKDVNGMGVQRELLKILEGAEIIVPREYMFTNRSSRARVNTRNMTFFALGAFSGFMRDGFGIKNVGFKRSEDKSENDIAYALDDREANDIYNFQNYGFLPELIARFTQIIPFKALDESTLQAILRTRILEYEKEFSNEGFELHIAPAVCRAIVAEAMERETGARGLDNVLVQYLTDIAFNHFGQFHKGTVALTMKKGHFNAEVRLSA